MKPCGSGAAPVGSGRWRRPQSVWGRLVSELRGRGGHRSPPTNHTGPSCRHGDADDLSPRAQFGPASNLGELVGLTEAPAPQSSQTEVGASAGRTSTAHPASRHLCLIFAVRAVCVQVFSRSGCGLRRAGHVPSQRPRAGGGGTAACRSPLPLAPGRQ